VNQPNESMPNRRQLYAFIALNAAPMPRDVTFYPRASFAMVDINFDSLADMGMWIQLFGKDPTLAQVDLVGKGGPRDPKRWRSRLEFEWAGWHVQLAATDRDSAGAVPPSLDDATRAELAAAAAGIDLVGPSDSGSARPDNAGDGDQDQALGGAR
jgi:hypothetical protein